MMNLKVARVFIINILGIVLGVGIILFLLIRIPPKNIYTIILFIAAVAVSTSSALLVFLKPLRTSVITGGIIIFFFINYLIGFNTINTFLLVSLIIGLLLLTY